jgi:hypothetical protein
MQRKGGTTIMGIFSGFNQGKLVIVAKAFKEGG